jgi:hypothetical protein
MRLPVKLRQVKLRASAQSSASFRSGDPECIPAHDGQPAINGIINGMAILERPKNWRYKGGVRCLKAVRDWSR